MTVSPATVATLATGATQQFTAVVKLSDGSTDNTGVTWSVTGGGSIAQTGIYTAPSTAQATAVTVTATSKKDNTTTGTATIAKIEAPAPVLKTIKITGADVGGTDAAPTLANAALKEGGTGSATATIEVATETGASLPANTAFTLGGTDAAKFQSTGLVTGSTTKTLTIKIASGTTAGDYNVTLSAGSGVTALPIKITVAAP